jgi:hypothetical protein
MTCEAHLLLSVLLLHIACSKVCMLGGWHNMPALQLQAW